MLPVSIWSYIWVGTCMRYLQDVKAGRKIHGEGFVLENIESFFNELSKLGLLVTERASHKLKEIKKNFEAKNEDSSLSMQESQELSKTMGEIRLTFEAETQGIFAYYVTEKHFDVKKLLENVNSLFKPNVFGACPETAQYDFKEAGLCIAFERSTAAAFHILRATEDVLRLYYKKYIRPVKKDVTWGQILNELKNKLKGKKPDSVLLNNLDNIRNSFRNPTQHPDKIYDIHEAQDLFSLCIDAVNRMITAK